MDNLRIDEAIVLCRKSLPVENANLYPVTEVPVTETGITFVEALKAGVTRLIDVDDWVEAWHTNPSLTTKSLRDYLGFSQELYAAWLKNSDALMALME